jgi:hypothetical protein
MSPQRRGVGVVLSAVLLVTGCSGVGGGGGATPSAETTASTAGPTGSATPTGTATALPSGAGGTASPSGSAAASGVPAACGVPDPQRVSRVEVAPRRPTEVAVVVSDGRNLTPGTRDQSDFLAPALTADDGSVSTDATVLQKVAGLVLAQRHRVLLTRPDPPDATAGADRKPYNAPGTYVAYNASGQLTADVTVLCGGQQQIWQFAAEGDPSTGQVNCAVEPARSNGMARLIYQNNC